MAAVNCEKKKKSKTVELIEEWSEGEIQQKLILFPFQALDVDTINDRDKSKSE